ncbi:hypothetical protein ABGT15_04290 [Flavobacterium enshiense]|uniref:hypothetical protein n=1 Tax=Flavobacterium enshiense TaxID=1341165 RepID=UPI00345CB86B
MKIGKELDYLLTLQKRKDAKERILKVYNALVYKKGNTKGYFNCPSAYLEKVNSRYYKVVNLLLEHKIIDFKSVNYDTTDLFNQRRKKFYDTEKGICMKYKFLIDVEEGYEYDLQTDYTTIYENEIWYSKTKKSLLDLGFPLENIRIKRDNFSRRLHTNITQHIEDFGSYRKLLEGGDYFLIDGKTTQPRLLWLHLQEIGLQDEKLNFIFENGLDFYQYILDRIPVLENDRDEAKDLFITWINGTGYIDGEKKIIRDIFPIANTFLKHYKTSDYKNICRLLQYKEAKIFIDDLLNNCPVEFCLSIHDALVVKKEDKDLMLNWCKERRPEIIFTLEEVKRKKLEC